MADRLGSNTDPSTADIQRVLVDIAIPELRFAMGEIYADVARICLNGSFDNVDLGGLDSEFNTKVMRRLELCSA